MERKQGKCKPNGQMLWIYGVNPKIEYDYATM